MSIDNQMVNSSPQTVNEPSASPASGRVRRWLSTSLIVVGLLFLSAGGLMAYLNSSITVEPPPPVGIVEPAPASSLDQNPPPALSEPASPDGLAEPASLSPPSLDENPLPVFTDDRLPQAALGQAQALLAAEPSLADAGLQSAPESGADRASDAAWYEAMRQAEQEVPAGGLPLSLAPTATPLVQKPPTRIVAPSIDLDSEVVPVGWKQVIQAGQVSSVWEVAEYAAGWHQNSALPGAGGNVVLSGHHNTKGEVFRYIVDLNPGDTITLYADGRPFTYEVESRFVVRDKGMSDEKRRENASWIGPFPDERLTLITCWPYTNNTHRVIVIAKPTG